MVVRQKQQFRNQQIGVIRADMSVANSLSEISNSMDRISNIAFKEAAIRAEEKGAKFVADLPDNKIMATDEKGNPVNLLNDLKQSLPTKGYGKIAQRTIEKELKRRFNQVAKNAYVLKAQELAVKYRFEPTKFQEEYANYLLTQAQPYDGEYRNAIIDAGEAYGASVKMNIIKNSLLNQERISALNWSNESEITYSHDFALGSENLGSDIDNFLNVLNNDESHKETKSIATNLQFTGSLKINGSDYENNRKSNFGQGVIMGFHQKLLDLDPLVANQLQRAVLNRNTTLKGLDLLKENLTEEEMKRIQKSLSFVDSNGDNLALNRTITSQRVIHTNGQTLEAKENLELQNNFSEDVLEKNNSIRNELQSSEYLNDIEMNLNNVQTKDIGSFVEKYIAEVREEGSKKQTTVIDGKTVTAKTSALSNEQILSIENKIRNAAELEVAERLVKLSIDESGSINELKTNKILEYLAIPSESRLKGFSDSEKQLLKGFDDFTQNVPKSVVENSFPFIPTEEPTGYSNAIRRSIHTKLEGLLTDATASSSFSQATLDRNAKMTAYANGLPYSGSSTKPDRQIADDIAFGSVPELDRANLLFTKDFVDSNNPEAKKIRTRIANLTLNQGLVPQAVVQGMQKFRYGQNINKEGFDSFYSFIMPFINEKVVDPATGELADRNVFANHDVANEVRFLKELDSAINLLGATDRYSIYNDFIEINADRTRLDNEYERLFPKKDGVSGKNRALAIIAKQTGGKNTTAYQLLTGNNEAALDLYLTRKITSARMKDVSDFKDFIKETLKENLGSGEGYILENQMISVDDDKALTRFAPKLLFGNKNMQVGFRDFSNTSVLDATNGEVSLLQGSLNGFGGGGSDLPAFFSLQADKESTRTLKGFLVPERSSSILKLNEGFDATNELEIRNQAGVETSFILHVSYNGELVPYIKNLPNGNKDFVRVKVKDFIKFYSATNGFDSSSLPKKPEIDENLGFNVLGAETQEETEQRKAAQEDKMQDVEILEQQLLTPGFLDERDAKLVERILRTPMSPDAKLRELQKIKDRY